MAQVRVVKTRIVIRVGFGFSLTHSRIADAALSAVVIMYKVEILGILMIVIVSNLLDAERLWRC